MYRLNNPIRSYDWGSYTALPSFMRASAESSKPQAELWIGAHSDSPSQAFSDNAPPQTLDTLLSVRPNELLGSESVAAFGKKLPFLTKVLAAKSALSLQVHPNKEQARNGFRYEESIGLIRNDPKRNYKDDNHKPEMIIALTDFTALCGFQDPAATAELFFKLAEACRYQTESGPVPQPLERIIATLSAENEEQTSVNQQRLRRAFESIISDPQTPALTEIVFEALKVWLPKQNLPKAVSQPLETVLSLYRLFPRDPGVLLSIMLNYVRLKPGEALFLPTGNVHAYLAGMGIEVMASSDNVLRGGLTKKHVDVRELMKLVNFRVLPLPLLKPLPTGCPGQRVFKPPIKDFQVQEVTLSRNSVAATAAAPIIQHGPLVILCVEGKTIVETSAGQSCLSQADSVFVGANEAPAKASLHPHAENCRLFAVTVAG